jgi:hypothetical protein
MLRGKHGIILEMELFIELLSGVCMSKFLPAGI